MLVKTYSVTEPVSQHSHQQAFQNQPISCSHTHSPQTGLFTRARLLLPVTRKYGPIRRERGYLTGPKRLEEGDGAPGVLAVSRFGGAWKQKRSLGEAGRAGRAFARRGPRPPSVRAAALIN